MQFASAMPPPKSALRATAAVSRGKPAAPDPTKQADRHAALGSLLLRADLAPDPLERLLAVCRVALYLATEPLRPGTRGFSDTPTAVLGHHYLSSRQLAEKHRGDSVRLFLQELCAHEPLVPTQHPKYYLAASSAALPAGAGSASGAAGAALAPAATMQLVLKPAAAVRQQQGGLLSQLAGGGGAKADAPAAWAECAFEGGVTITFPRHAESYTCTLPAMALAAPLAQACPLDLSGTASVACEATGLSAALRFRPFKGGWVEGSVGMMLGDGHQQVASISGSWQSVVAVEAAEGGAGVLFEASQFTPPLSLALNLAEPGPRAATRLWAAMLEALVYVDAAAASKEGKRGGELAAALPPHLRRSLLYEMESSGLKPKKGAAAAEEEAAAAAATAAGDPGVGLLPPCVLSHRSMHGGLSYQLHYRLQPSA